MGIEVDRDCPACGEQRTFHRSASTTLHLGVKSKWYCGECGHRIVRINGEVDTAET